MEIEKTVYFVRHGQSAANAAPVSQKPESPLNAIGKAQAARIAERISKLSFDALIASPFRRAHETAEQIGKATGKEVELSELFVERVKPTSVDGKSHDDGRASTVWREWNKSLYVSGVRVEDGENFDDLIARADKALEFLTNRTEQSIVVVTHGYFLRTILARLLLGDALLPKAFENFIKSAATENTGLTVIRYQGEFEENPKWRLWIYNDHEHLAD